MSRPYVVAFRCSLALSLIVAAVLTAWQIAAGSVPTDTIRGLALSRWWTMLTVPVPVCAWVYLKSRLQAKKDPTLGQRFYVDFVSSALMVGMLYGVAGGIAWFLAWVILIAVLAVVVPRAVRIGTRLRPWLLAEDPSPRP